MARLSHVLDGLAQAMENGVPELTTALSREADETDNTVEWPHGDITIVSNVRADQWNTDFVGYATDTDGNQIGYLYDAAFDGEFQLNIWQAAPNVDYDIQRLGGKMERHFRQFENNRYSPEPLPDGEGGVLNDVSRVRIMDGGQLPTESANSPIRGYQITVDLRFNDRIDTSIEYGEMDYIVSVDTPQDGDLTDTDPNDEVAIEYIPA